MKKMRRYPLISVILSIYNHPVLVRNCLTSFRLQKYKNLEIFCISGGVTDAVQRVIYEFSDLNITMIPTDDRNQALGKISGEYLVVCTSDDCYDSFAFLKMIQFAEHCKAPAVFFNTRTIFESGQDRRRYDGLFPAYSFYFCHDGGVISTADISRAPTTIAAYMMRSSVVFMNNLKFPDIQNDNGCSFIYSYLMSVTYIAGISEILTTHIVRPESGFKNANKFLDKRSEVLKFALSFAKKSQKRKKYVHAIEYHLDVARIGHPYMKLCPRKNIQKCSVHLVDHCNLRCKSCSHFSCLAKPGDFILKADDFARDMRRLSKITRQALDVLELYGGEPLLHPDVPSIMRIARRHFPRTEIKLITNGILLAKQSESFWRAVKKYDIVIAPTRYPVKVGWDEVYKLVDKYKVKFGFFSNGSKKGEFYHKPLDLSGGQDRTSAFLNCLHAGGCMNLYKGRLYPCPVAAYIHYFNRRFNQNLCVSTADYIDLHEKHLKLSDVLDFMSRPVPFCKYCKTGKTTFGQKWQQTKEEIEEWI